MNIFPRKIAIIADWLIDFGGAELVISHLLELYPDADIYTSVCYMDHPMLEGRRVYTSWLQRIPFFNRHHKLAGILRPWAFRSFDLSGYDIIICSSSAESKQVAMGRWNRKNPPSPLYQGEIGTSSTLQTVNCKLQTLVVYCHTPTRYYWSHAREYEDMMEFGFWNPLVKWVFRMMRGWMQKVDYEAAQRVDHFIANSKTTQERIQKYYNRESEVIYPGVDTKAVEKSHISLEVDHKDSGLTANEYYLGLGRCIPYKRFDLLIDAFNANGKRLILCTATDTSLFRELRSRSEPNIEWKFRVSEEEKLKLMTHAKAFLFPPEEDFGLVPVEAMMCGTPVIAYAKGGATESVIDGETGVFFSPQTSEAMNEAIKRFEQMEWDREKIRVHAKRFEKERFHEKIENYIGEK